jgi:hypothetical protein
MQEIQGIFDFDVSATARITPSCYGVNRKNKPTSRFLNEIKVLAQFIIDVMSVMAVEIAPSREGS